MTASGLLKLIPEKLFRELAVETKVDTQVKKLSGELMFKLILFSMLDSEKISLRVMETFLQSAKFKSFTQYDIIEGKYNSIGDRICTINANYFEKLFTAIFSIYNKELKEERALSRCDSTYVGLAAKLFSTGMENGKNDFRFVKYSVNLKGSIPSSIKVFTEQCFISEDMALGELIDYSDCLQGDVVVFDRGLQSRKAFERFTTNGKYFVSRCNPHIRQQNISQLTVQGKPANTSVTVLSDETGMLINEKNKLTQHQYRVIKCIINKTHQPICFVTNILSESAYTLAEWYRQRWDIEAFFKFIKQHLNAKHLVSRKENGIKVMIYMTMIVAVLLLAYKKLNRIKGFKIAKLKFTIELETEIIKTIVTFCGGNPQMAPHLFNSS